MSNVVQAQLCFMKLHGTNYNLLSPTLLIEKRIVLAFIWCDSSLYIVYAEA